MSDKIVWCHSRNNALYNMKIISSTEDIPDPENPENKLMLTVLHNLMDYAY
jgi:hypothetical protein